MEKGLDYTGISVVFFCHDGQGNFLFSKRGKNCRDENGRWDPGGGGLEFGARVEDVLKKEIKEEYGADIQEYEFLGYRDILRKFQGQKTHWLALDFKVRLDRAQVKNGEPHKFDEIAWFTLDALPSPVHSQLPSALQKYRQQL